jgi:hypothetical protein
MYPKGSVVDSYLFQNESGSSSDPHQSNKLDPDPQHSDKLLTSQNVWNMRLFEHFFKVLSLIWKLGAGFGSASKRQAGSGSGQM